MVSRLKASSTTARTCTSGNITEPSPSGSLRARLDGVLREADVAKDPIRDRHASIADLAGEVVEGLLVAPFRPVHDLAVHPFSLPSIAPRWARSHGRGSGGRRRFSLRDQRRRD